MTVPFTRILGARSGVQLNEIIDATERYVPGSGAMAFAAMGSFKRGRIDKAFRVNKDNLFRMLGKPVSPVASANGEPYVQIYDAFKNGAIQAVIVRYSKSDDAILYCSVLDEATSAAAIISNAAKQTGWQVAFKHLEAFDEGINVKVNARKTLNDSDVAIASNYVTIILSDISTGKELFKVEGSLDPLAVDEFNNTIFIGSAMDAISDLVEIEVATDAEFDTTFAGYGLNTDGTPKYADLNVTLITHGVAALNGSQKQAMTDQLANTEYDFKYIMLDSLAQTLGMSDYLVQLAKDQNKKLVLDLQGTLTPAEAITAFASLNIDTLHADAYWAPLKRNDILNGGKITSGLSGMQIGMRCARNAKTNADGVPPMNYPVAGKNFPITSSGITQLYTASDSELNDLAEAHINPIQSVKYNAGARYVFVDSLTTAKTTGASKLINVSEMGITVDDWVAGYANEVLQLPMADAIAKMATFLKALFEGIESAKWITPSEELEGASYIATVARNNQRPDDRMDVGYFVHYDGTNRAVYVQQTFSK